MSINPLVTCVCLTYNRPRLVEESIQCFIDQKYDNKELIVLCDNPNCLFELETNHHQIQVINVMQRFKSLGAKYNYVKKFVRGSYVCIWEDDDLFGFNRIGEQVTHFKDNIDVVKGSLALVSMDNRDYSVGGNLFHSQSCFTADYFLNKPFIEGSFGVDCDFEQGARSVFIDPSPLHWYIYRWGNCAHLSGTGDSPNVWEAATDLSLKGRIKLRPQYHRNYWLDILKFYQGQGIDYQTWQSLYQKEIEKGEFWNKRS